VARANIGILTMSRHQEVRDAADDWQTYCSAGAGRGLERLPQGAAMAAAEHHFGSRSTLAHAHPARC